MGVIRKPNHENLEVAEWGDNGSIIYAVLRRIKSLNKLATWGTNRHIGLSTGMKKSRYKWYQEMILLNLDALIDTDKVLFLGNDLGNGGVIISTTTLTQEELYHTVHKIVPLDIKADFSVMDTLNFSISDTDFIKYAIAYRREGYGR